MSPPCKMSAPGELRPCLSLLNFRASKHLLVITAEWISEPLWKPLLSSEWGMWREATFQHERLRWEQGLDSNPVPLWVFPVFQSVAARLKSCHLTTKMCLVEEAVRPLLSNCLGLRMHEIHMCFLTARILGQPDLGAVEWGWNHPVCRFCPWDSFL